MEKNEMKGMQTACRVKCCPTSHGCKRKKRIGRRILSYLLTLAMVLGLFTWGPLAPEENVKEAKAEVTSLTGSGTAANPYKISSVDELKFMRDKVNANDSTYDDQSAPKYYELTDDLTLTDNDWVPIGKGDANVNTYYFNGKFNGKGHVITLNIQSGSSYSGNSNSAFGLFGGGGDGFEVKNLKVTGTVTSSNSGANVGGIVGVVYLSYGTAIIDNCESDATISSVQGAGGIVGRIRNAGCSVTNCVNSGDITQNTSTASNQNAAGGIVGSAFYLSDSAKINISRCYNTGNISSTSSAQSAIGSAGGILGGILYNNNQSPETPAQITNCYNTGTVSGRGNNPNWSGAGGIVGFVGQYTKIKVSYSFDYGVITTTTTPATGYNKCLGGIMGASGEYSGMEVLFENNYYRKDTSSSSVNKFIYGWGVENGASSAKTADVDGNSPVTTDNFNKESSFSGFNFSTVWTIEEGASYPTFQPLVPPTPVCEIVETETEYFSLQEALDAVTDGGTIRLLGDATENVTLNKSNATITLDLNDFAIISDKSIDETDDDKRCSTITILGGELKIQDMATEKTTRYYYLDNDGLGHVVESDTDENYAAASTSNRGTFSGGYICGGEGFWLYKQASNAKGGNIYIQSGSLSLEGGTIIGGRAVYGGGIGYDDENTSFLMSGGLLVGNIASTVNGQGGGVWAGAGTIELNGGQILRNTSAKQGGGLYLSGGSTTIEGEDFKIKENTSLQGGGGGLALFGDANVNMLSGTITGNKTSNYGVGAGVYIDGDYSPVFSLTDGTISGNVSASAGGGINLAGTGTLLMYGGTITENSASTGGGVANSGFMTMSGGSITENNARIFGGGLMSAGGGLNLSGAVDISENTSDTYTQDNVLLTDSAIIGISDTLTNTTPIGVRILDFDSNHNPVVSAGTVTNGLSGAYGSPYGGLSNFAADEDGQQLVLSENGEVIIPAVSVKRGNDTYYYGDLSSAIMYSQDGDVVKLTSDVKFSSIYVDVNHNITLDLNGKTISSTYDPDQFMVDVKIYNNSRLTITDSSTSGNGIIDEKVRVAAYDGGTVNFEAGAVTYVGTAGTATLNISGGCIGTLFRANVTMDDTSTDGIINISGGYFKDEPDNEFLVTGAVLQNYSSMSPAPEDWEADTSTYPYRVYVPHLHEFVCSSTGNIITAKCLNTDGGCGLPEDSSHNHTGKWTITAPTSPTYDGNTKEATVTRSDNNLPLLTASYQKKNASNGWDDIDSAPVDAGTYRATITLTNVRTTESGSPTETVSAVVQYTIAKATGPAAPSEVTASIDGSTLTVTAPDQVGSGTPESPYIYEYSVDGGTTWQDSTTFSGLTPGETFSVKAREKGTDNVEAGAVATSSSYEIPLAARIGDVDYASINEAIQAMAQDPTGSGSIQLLEDVTENLTIPVGDITIDLNGYEISGNITMAGCSGSGDVANLTIQDNSNEGTGTVSGNVLAGGERSNITLEGGIYSREVKSPGSSSSLTIKGGCFTSASTIEETIGNLTIQGGYFESDPSTYYEYYCDEKDVYEIEQYSETSYNWEADSSVYGYRIKKKHAHVWTNYNAVGNKIYATCTADGHEGDTTLAIITLDVTDGKDNVAPVVTVLSLIDGIDESDVTFKKGDVDQGSTLPTEAGGYTACITYQGKTAKKSFRILPPAIGNDGYPYGSNMSASSVTLNVVQGPAGTTYQWQRKAADVSTFQDISGATNASYTFSTNDDNDDGAWYRCKVGEAYSKAIQLIKSKNSVDRYNRTWTRVYRSSPWYLSNGTMAYTIDTANKVFDVVGEFRKNGKSYMLQTTYGGQGWTMYSSNTGKPASASYSSATKASLDDVRFAFADDRYVLNIEADLASGQKSFAFGSDTQLGNSSTSGSYADYAALASDRTINNELKQISMIGAATKNLAKEDDPAFVIAPLGIKASESSLVENSIAPLYWLGVYHSRKPYDYATDYQTTAAGKTAAQLDSYSKIGDTIKASGLSSNVTGVVTSQKIDTGMTMSWFNVPSGNTVKFRFSVGDVASTGAISGNVNYGDETLEGLEPGATYTVSNGNTTKELTADYNGAVKLAGDDYDFFGSRITVSRTGYDPLSENLAARPTPLIGSINTTPASRPIDIREDEITATASDIIIHLDKTSTNADMKKKLSQEYCLYDNLTQVYRWTTADADGNVTFSGLDPNKLYTIEARVPATLSAPASRILTGSTLTKKAVTFTKPDTINRGASAKLTDVSCTGGGSCTVNYSKALDELYGYTTSELSFSTAGRHTVYYRIDFEYNNPLYGSYDVIINPTVTFHAVGGTLTGAVSGESETKSIEYGKTVKTGIGIVGAQKTSGDLTAFAGWYADTGYSDLWDNDALTHTPVTEDLDLYAKWAQSLNTFGDAQMTGFDWTQVTYLQLFKGNIPVSERKQVNNGAFTFTNIPDGEYELVITMKPGTGNTDERKVISTLCNVKRDTVNNVSIVHATPYASGQNINSKLEVADGTPDILVGRLDFETKNNAVSYWDQTLEKKTSDTSGDPDVSYHVDLTLQAENQYDWTKVNISDAQAAAHLSQEERTLRGKQAALMSLANADSVSGLTYLDIGVTKSIYQRMNEGGDITETLLGTQRIDSTANVLEIVIPWQTTDVVPKVYRHTGGVAKALTKLTNRATDSTGYTDGTFYVGSGFVVVYTKSFSTFAIGSKTVAPATAIGYGFVNYDTEKFQNTHVIGDTTYFFSDYEISTTSEFSAGTIMSLGDAVVEASKTGKNYYIRRKAHDGLPASAYTSFSITRPNAPDEGMFTFTNSSTDAAGSANGVIQLNDITAGASLQYYNSTSGTWRDFLTDYPTGILSPAALGEYQFRFKPDPENRSLSSTVMKHTIIKEVVELSSVSISGTSKFGETLTANVTGTNTTTGKPGNPTGVTYEWYRIPAGAEPGMTGTQIAGAEGSTYTLTKDDIGYEIYVVVKQTPEGGSPITRTTGHTSLVTAAPGSSEKPRLKPEDISKTHNSITINYPKEVDPEVTYEYSIDGGETWQTGKTFNGLTGETPYTPMVRIKEKTDTVEGKTIVTVESGAESNPFTIITDENQIDVGSVSIQNRSVSGPTDTAFECGDTLVAVAIQQNGKPIAGAAYQWMRASSAAGDYSDIPGATGETYVPTANDLGKYLKVKATKNNTQTSTAVGAVIKAVTTSAPDVSATSKVVSITATDTTITVSGLRNDESRGIVYEYGIREAGSEGEYSWQRGNTFTGLTATTQAHTSRYEVVVRVAETPTREQGPISEPSRTVIMLAKGMPFNAGSQEAKVVMPDYVFGTTPPVPALNVKKNEDAGDITYSYSTDSVVWKEATGGKLPDGINGLKAGTYYIKGTIAESEKYDTYTTGVTLFHVLKAPKGTETGITGVDPDTRKVTLNNSSGKTLEYAVIPDGGTLADAVWVRAVVGDDGTFIINSVLDAGDHTVYVREKESDDYEASAPKKFNFTLNKYSVVYDANSGIGTVPSTTYAVQGDSVPIDNDWSNLSRTGYDFAGWSDDVKQTDKAEYKKTTVNTAKRMYAIWIPHIYTIHFEMNGGQNIADKTGVRYGDRVALPIGEYTDDSKTFLGWAKTENGNVIYAGREIVKNLTPTNNDTVTLYAKWTVSTGTVAGEITSTEGSESTIRLMQGNTQWGDAKTIAMNLSTSGYSGTFSFPGVPYGAYNLVIEQEVTDEQGNVIEVLTKTVKINVDGSEIDLSSDQLQLPASARSKLLVIGDDTPAAVVDGLDTLAKSEAESMGVTEDDRSVTITMSVEQKVEKALAEDASEDDIETQEAIQEIKKKDGGDSVENEKKRTFLNIGIQKEVSRKGIVLTKEKMTSVEELLEIILPYDASSVYGHIFMYHFHDGKAVEIPLIKHLKNKKNGCFYIDEIAEKIHLFSRDYSTFAIVVDTKKENKAQDDTPGGGGSGGGSGSGGSSDASPSPTPTATPSATPTAIPTVTPDIMPEPSISPAPTVKPGTDYDPIEDPNDIDLNDDDAITKNGRTVYDNKISLNSGLKVSQPGNKVKVTWGKVPGANRYEVYVAYCGSKFAEKPTKVVRKSNVRKVVIKKLNGKKLKLKKNYKLYVVAYKVENGFKYKLVKSITAHIVGRKNKKYSNPKAISIRKMDLKLKRKKSIRLKPTVILVNPKRKSLSAKHAPLFRYASSDRSIVSVSKKGRIRALKKGSCIVYIYAKNGYAKAVKVKVR